MFLCRDQTMTTVKNYLSLIKFSHTIFAMPFALIGFCLAIFESTSLIPGWQRKIFPPAFNSDNLIVKFSLVLF
jgi:4-hydroxybenzoate polyprenyltransferase